MTSANTRHSYQPTILELTIAKGAPKCTHCTETVD
jgi:hypothetical protein